MKYKFKTEDFERFATEHGLGKLKYLSNEIRAQYCPYCKGATQDKDTFAINRVSGAFNCKRETCQARGNMITLARDFNFSLGRDIDEYYAPRKQYKDIRRYPKPEIKPAAVSYMESRGISRMITEKYQVTVRKDNESVLIFLFYDDRGELQFIKYRNTNPKPGQNKEWCEANTKPILFGMNHCDSDNSDLLVMTEGQIDSLSVTEAFDGDINVVSVPLGAKGFTWVPYCWDFLGKFTKLVVFGDHERGKITLLDEMTKRFHGSVAHVRPDDYRDCKDANELLVKYGKEAVRTAVENAEIVPNRHLVDLSKVQRKDISKMPKLNSGIPSLDKMTGGLYMGQLILLTGERGNGKSTFASQLGARAIAAGYNVMFYSGELLDWFFRDWFDRQIAGNKHINILQSNLGYQSYSVEASAQEMIADWYSGRAYLYGNEIADDGEEEETLLTTVKDAICRYNCSVIIIDNLMSAMTDDTTADLYRQQTKFVKSLERIVKHYGVLIILVAHPRKRNGYEFSNDDVSGSANITNLADVVMRYTRPKDTSDDTMRLLQVFKNRINGKVDYDGIPLYFQESSKRISESGTFDWAFGWEKNDFTPVTNEDEIPW